MGTRAARFNYERIKILRPTISRNEYGELVQDYELIKETKAIVDFVTGDSIIVNLSLGNSYSIKVTVRSYIKVQETDLIEWNNYKYSIDYIKFDRAKMTNEIKCNRILE